MTNTPTQIILHHDGVSRSGPSFDVVNAYHKQRQFPISSLGYYVGYHYWIERDGAVRQAREDTEEGAHCIGQNSNSIGIGMAGNFDIEWPTQEQIAALASLLLVLCVQYDIPASRIVPHRKYAEKTCFGTRLSDEWGRKVLAYAFTRKWSDMAPDMRADALREIAEPK